MEHENFWAIMDSFEEDKEMTVVLRLRSGKEFIVKIDDINNYDDNNAEVTLEEAKKYIILDVDSIEYIEVGLQSGD